MDVAESAHSRGICVHLLFGFVMGNKCGCCVDERVAGFLPMSLTTSVAIPMDVAPRTYTTRAHRRYCPRRKARHFVWRGGVVCVAAGVALATTGGKIRRFSQDKHKHTPGPDQEHTHTQASQSNHTRGRARAHLCVVALLGGCGWLSLSGGRRESGLPPTFVSVRSVVTDLSTCVAYVSAHLKHTCVKSYHNGTFL